MKGKVDIQEFYSVLDSLYEKKEMDKAEPYMLEVLQEPAILKTWRAWFQSAMNWEGCIAL